jgi:hypothetical protein
MTDLVCVALALAVLAPLGFLKRKTANSKTATCRRPPIGAGKNTPPAGGRSEIQCWLINKINLAKRHD